MTQQSDSDSSNISNRGKWMALTAALLGWMFDGFEIGMFPLTGRPALTELLPDASQIVRDQWFGVITAVFLIGAATGGVLFGWLGDRIGRVRSMALSILTYAVFTGLCGFATEAWHIAVLRFAASLGMGGEWSLGVALVNEIWPQRSRAFIAGLIGAAANVGMVLVPLLSLTLAAVTTHVSDGFAAIGIPSEVVDRLMRNNAWRLLMIAGALPAVLVFFIRMAVPESERWKSEKAKGATAHWATYDLLGAFAGMLAACAVIFVWSPAAATVLSSDSLSVARLIVTPIGLLAALLGFLYPVLMYLRRAIHAGEVTTVERRTIVSRLLLGAGLSGVALLGTWGSLQWAAKWAGGLAEGTGATHAIEYTQLSLSLGAVFGTILAALTADRIGRRLTYTLLCFGSMASLLVMYQTNESYGNYFLTTVFFAGGITAAFYGWFPLYLPELFRTSIRATSQGFAYNFGRVIAAIGTLQTAQVMGWFDGSFPKAGSVLSVIYLVGALLVWLGPETKGRQLPD